MSTDTRTDGFAFDGQTNTLYTTLYLDSTKTTNIMRCINDQWHPIGSVPGKVYTLTYHPDFQILFIGGSFNASEQIPTNNIAAWHSGEERWLNVGNANSYPSDIVVNPNTGDIFVGGSFSTIGTAPVNKIAFLRPDQLYELREGSVPDWQGLPAGQPYPDKTIYSIAFDANNHMYVGGLFTKVGDTQVNGIAKWDWDTGSWSALGSGVTGSPSPTFDYVIGVYILHFDVATERLYAGGAFTTAGQQHAGSIAIWNVAEGSDSQNDANWHPLGSNRTLRRGWVGSIAVAPHNHLCLGGAFDLVDPSDGNSKLASNLIMWNGSQYIPLPATAHAPFTAVYGLTATSTSLYIVGKARTSDQTSIEQLITRYDF